MRITCAGILLSGGLNRRMGGRNKALIDLGGRSFVERILTALQGCFNELLLVTRQPEIYSNLPLRIVEDIFSIRTPLSGIHSGLMNMTTNYGFVTSCDTPLLKEDLVRVLIGEIDTGFDIVVPASGSYFQPLCAVYSKRCLPVVENQLRRGEVKTDRIYEELKVKRVSYDLLKVVDPDLLSFFNVNTPEDLETVVKTLDLKEGEQA